jgi:hypothetical protein
MSLARVSLLLTAAAFGGFGAFLFIQPAALEAVGLAVTRPAAAVEIRAFYGGLELGLAAFFLAASFPPVWFRPALLLQILTLGGAAAGRLLGVLVGGGGEPLIWALFAAETAGAGLGLLALRTLR